jgi:nucleotide-binding universal stress UspA family protein
MLKHILIPLDQSALAETALDYAPKLIGPDSQITLLTVLVPPDLSISALYGTDGMAQAAMDVQSYESVERQIRVQAEDYLRGIARRLASTGARVDIAVQVGRDAEVIVENARELKVDAIVMATHGRSGISRWLLGSVTQKVLSAAPCPVMVIPHHREEA